MRFIVGLMVAAGALMLWHSSSQAAGCKGLDTQPKIKSFMERTKSANPLWRENLSVYLEVSPCEGATCSAKQRKKRIALLQNLHLLRSGENRRAYVIKGPNSAQCVLSRESRNYLCAQCDATTNIACRSVVRENGSGQIVGTNIDTNDFQALTSPHFKSSCSPVDKKPDLLRVESKRMEGDFPYDRIVSIFDGKREVPITINYYAEGALRKVYRFFPKYYTKMGEQWIATIIRIRTTRGSEKQYVFETQLRVLKERGEYLLYLDPATDPRLKGYDIHALFFTN